MPCEPWSAISTPRARQSWQDRLMILRGLWARLTGRPFVSATTGDHPRVAVGDTLRIRVEGEPTRYYRVTDCDADRTVILTVTPLPE